MSIHFSGATPALTQGLYTHRLPEQNSAILDEMRSHLPERSLLSDNNPDIASTPSALDLFEQDQRWVFCESNGALTVKHVKNTDQSPAAFPPKPWTVRDQAMSTWLRGGNTYIGIDDDNNPFALVGKSSITTNNSDLKGIAKDLGLKTPESIIEIPQLPNPFQYDIDTFLRPLGNKTLLLYDPEESKDFIAREGLDLLSPLDETSAKRYQETADLLEEKGFNIIRAPGMFLFEDRRSAFHINLLNAVVLKNPETGKLIYLTMSPSKTFLQDKFSQWLQQQCPEVEKVVYVSGGPPLDVADGAFPNRMVEIFNRHKAGLHCLFAELIDGARWREANH